MTTPGWHYNLYANKVLRAFLYLPRETKVTVWVSVQSSSTGNAGWRALLPQNNCRCCATKPHSIAHYHSVKNIASKITQLKINHPAMIAKVTLQW